MQKHILMLCLLIVFGNDMPINKTVVLHKRFGGFKYIIQFRTICRNKSVATIEARIADPFTSTEYHNIPRIISTFLTTSTSNPTRSTISEEPFNLYEKSTPESGSLIIESTSPHDPLCKYKSKNLVI